MNLEKEVGVAVEKEEGKEGKEEEEEVGLHQ
jgi:hypothetical protein